MRLEPKNKNYQDVIKAVLDKQYFMKHVGIEMANCNPGRVKLKLALQQEHMQQVNFVHGGVTSTLSDIAMGFAALSLVEENKGMVTADLHISFLRPAYGDEIWVEGWVTKPGNTLYFCEAKLWTINAEGEETEVAKAFATMCSVDKH